MNIDHLLTRVRSGELDIAEARQQLDEWFGHREKVSAQERVESEGTHGESVSGPGRIDDTLGYAQLDIDRSARTGFPEVIFGEGKTAEQIAAIFERFMLSTGRALATRVSRDKAEAVLKKFPEAVYYAEARALAGQTTGALTETSQQAGYIAVVCAGTSDVPVAEEAAVTAQFLGTPVERVYDVGVAGIHRLFRRLDVIRGADAVVVVAGMEGALASVIGGLVEAPVVAVPTSIGYGASFQGLAALLAMLNACAPGISVVNIDNGFGAGYYASLIYKNANKTRS